MKRIIGIDVARAFAVAGMIIVNFKIVLGQSGDSWLKSFAAVFEGKAAATFVLLAGLGLALMTKSAIAQQDAQKLRRARRRIFKRALFLFALGLSYIAVWPADILHFYGLYMLVILTLLKAKPSRLLWAAAAFVLAFPLLFLLLDYGKGWNFETLDYADFWTPEGFVRHLFFNGFHPVVPWTAFMLMGYWLGRQDLYQKAFLKKVLGYSLASLVLLSLPWSHWLAGTVQEAEANTLLALFLSSSPMPPLPLYMLTGMSTALAVITACILGAERWAESFLVKALYQTGQLALTFYVAHVIVGMGTVELWSSRPLGSYSAAFSVTYALLFSLGCVLFALLWLRYKKMGPLEWVMRKVTDG